MQRFQPLQRQEVAGKKLLRREQASQCAALGGVALQRTCHQRVHATVRLLQTHASWCVPGQAYMAHTAPLDGDTEITERWMMVSLG